MLALGALGTQSGPEGASDATPAIAPRPVVPVQGRRRRMWSQLFA
jgi:hypothetical protein